MSRKFRPMGLWVACLLSLLNVGCPFGRTENPKLPIGPDVTADLLIYFHRGTFEEQIEAFSNNVISKPDGQGTGHAFAPGVRTQLRLHAVEGHEGYAITFFPNATKQQREELVRSIQASPIVYKILKNTAPDDVKTLK